MVVLLLVILVIYVTLVYAPIAAFLVELVRTRTRHPAVRANRSGIKSGNARIFILDDGTRVAYIAQSYIRSKC